MRINNISDVSFKGVYVVEGPPKASWEADASVPKQTLSGELFTQLSLAGYNKQIALMKKGGMFQNTGIKENLADNIDINFPPLLLVNDNEGQPAKKVKRFVHRTMIKLKKVYKLNVKQLKSGLTTAEINEALQTAREGKAPSEKTALAKALVEKTKINAAKRYKQLYEELAQKAVVKKLTGVDSDAIGYMMQEIKSSSKLLP